VGEEEEEEEVFGLIDALGRSVGIGQSLLPFHLPSASHRVYRIYQLPNRSIDRISQPTNGSTNHA
jgi:hypothetical protein